MIKFEKVSYEQFYKDSIKLGYDEKEILEAYDKIKIPTRSSEGSAGYDFVSPYSFLLFDTRDMKSGDLYLIRENAIIPTGIRVKMDEDTVLLLCPRSGIGFKTGTTLANTTGVIDSDYYNSKNEGHIMAKFCYGFKELQVSAGDRIMQGIFLPFFTTDDDCTTSERDGGFGSSGK